MGPGCAEPPRKASPDPATSPSPPCPPAPCGASPQDRELLITCEGIIKELRARVMEHVSATQQITDGLREILTPQQIARFLTWVTRNSQSMAMLRYDWEVP